jgi:hypothetical protein
MPALLTHRDRQIHRLRREIETRERWLAAEMSDRRVAAFHHAKLAELRSELNKLEELQ